MNKGILVLALLATLPAIAAEPSPAPLPPHEAAVSMAMPEGFRVTVFAAEPDVVQPISMCIDGRGRLFVAEALNYGAWQATGKDRIVILEDTDGDGRCDSRQVFYEGLNYVTGIEVGFGGVWAVSPPNLYFIADRDGDDQPDDEPQVLLDGFGYQESRHNLANGFTWGPDGWLYGGHGRTSPSDVGPPGTPAEERIHCDGGVYRIHPTRLIFENFADGTTNPWGVDFDDFGQCFVSNCVNPHLFHMIQGGHYEPWRNRPSSLYAYERLPTCADHLHYPTGKPDQMRGETAETLAMGGGHAHCGTLIYLGDQFPPSYRNSVFMCNVHGRRVNNDLLQRKGSGYTASHGADLMVSRDPWFMGVTLRTGPDGSVFVTDWSDTGECHTYQPQKETGRIYRISYGEPEKAHVDLAQSSDDELVKLQLHRNDWYVRHARRLLQERAAKDDFNSEPVHAALREMLDSREHDVPQRLRALWALHATGGLDDERLLALLDDRAEHLRAWSIQLLCERPPVGVPASAGVPSAPPKGGTPTKPILARFAELAKDDPSPVVRLYLASALQRLPFQDRWAIAEGLLGHADDRSDANLPLMIWYGIEPLAGADPEKASQLATGVRIPLVRQFIARRIVDDAIVRKDEGDLSPIVAVLGGASEEVQLDLLQGIREGLRGQKNMEMPEGWQDLYVRLSRSENRAIRDHAMVVALVFGDPQALADLRKTALASTSDPAERIAALEALIEKRVSDLAIDLHGLLADKPLRRIALRGLAALPHDATPQRVLEVYADLSSEEKQDAVATLASRKEYALQLLAAIEEKTMPRTDVSAYVARQLYALGDDQVTGRLREVWGEVRESSDEKRQQLESYKKLLSPGFLKRADFENGRAIYQKTCQQCHKLYGEGGAVGPDLTGSNRSNLDYLLANLVDPSSEVAQDYRMSTLETTDGRVVTGIVERGPNRVIIQTATDRIILPADEVETVMDSPLSIMPEGQLATLTKEQVRDLIAYLAEDKQWPSRSAR